MTLPAPLLARLRSSDGIMRSSSLAELGYSRYRLAPLLGRGELIRPQRGWIALPGTDPQLLHAAQNGVVLSCLTVADRHGLWVRHRGGPLHVAAPNPHAHLRVDGHVIHWARPVVRRAPHLLVDSLENALAYIVACQPREEAHAIWESALNKSLVTRESLLGLPLGGSARSLLLECTPFSDSGLESYVRRRVQALGLSIVAQAWLLGHKVDFLIDGWLVLQIDGATHTGEQRDEDNRHDALLRRNGYDVIRVSYRQVMFEWPWVQGQIMLAISQGRP